MADIKDNNTTLPPQEILPPEQLIVCTWCSTEEVKLCFKCNKPFCTAHASRLTPQACKDCFNGVTVFLDKFTRVTEDYDSVTDQMVTRRESCDRIRLDGPDYVFYQDWVHKLMDDELKSVFEFHYFIVKLIEHENEIRKVKKTQKLRETTPILSSKTTEVKVKRETKPKDMRSELKKLGLPDVVIDQMIAAAQAGGKP